MKNIKPIIVAILIVFQFVSCQKVNDTPIPTVTWSKTVDMSPKFEVPAVADRPETGVAELKILSDNTLVYSIVVSNLKPGDAIVAAHIHIGNAGVSGPVYIPFPGPFVGSTISGTVSLRPGQADTVKTFETYVNAHTTQVGSGLIRGQIDSKVVFACDRDMHGENEVPPVNTTATGLAIIRMTENKKLYIKASVNNLEPNDTMTLAHFHKGSSSVSGPVILGFYTTTDDFGKLKIISLNDDVFYNSLLNDSVYVNTHSKRHPSGIIRGQIR